MMIQSIVDSLITPDEMFSFLDVICLFFILNIKNINLYLWVNAVNEGTFEF